MKKKLTISLNKDEKLFNLILENESKVIFKKFVYEVRILKKNIFK